MTAENVLDAVLSDDEDEFDDPGEPIMEGSDDEFSDLEGVGDDDDDNCTDPPGDTSNGSDPTPLPQSSEGSPSSSQPTSWSSNLTRVTINPFPITSLAGPTLTLPTSPLEIFKLFFHHDLVCVLVEESNRYAKEVMGDEKFSTWNPITGDEIKAFLGFSVFMGINRLPSLDDYWTRDPLLRYHPIASRITRDRFREISRFFHFVDNSTLTPRGTPGHDRLGKVRPVITHLSQKFAQLYKPHRELAVDEAMIKFQGRSCLKQYLPLKPIKRGIKVWVLADSHNGYFCKFDVYTGKDGTAEKGLGARVVKSLTSELKGKNHHIYFDNYFTSESLLSDLVEDGIYACGTARQDRKGFPDALKKIKFSNR